MSRQPRPQWQFTVPSGWLSDPYGVTWRDGRYELFFQFNPDAPQWSASLGWGQADSPNLVRWSPPRRALMPSGPDAGCWSGSAVIEDGRPLLLYTAVDVDAPDLGRIAIARGDASFGKWAAEPASVLDGPPPGLAAAHFRDPYVWRTHEGWHMVLGAGSADGAAAVLGYTSANVRDWTFRGVICSRPVGEIEPEWTGSVWECPQLFELDGAWVLIVSVAHEGITRHVTYAVGAFDGSTFVPRCWQRLLHGDAPYATTTFLDAAGRRCALSWLRETGPVEDRAWAGALSAPLELRRDGDRVVVTPHSDIDSLRTGIRSDLGPARLGRSALRVGAVGAQSDVLLAGRLSAGDALEATLFQEGATVLTLRLSGDTVALRRPGRPDEPMPLGVAPDGGFELRLLLDAGVAEVFTAGGASGVRTAPFADAGELSVTACAGRPELVRLTVYDLTR